MLTSNYIGRFAPSPTGPLHFGSLVAAVASYCDAKAHGGKWLVRMEDVDRAREMPGAADDILHTLEAYGFEWDDKVIYQSQRDETYHAAFTRLQAQQLVYACTCSRKEIADSALKIGIEGVIYPRTCYQNPKIEASLAPNIHATYRVVTKNRLICFRDEIQGEVKQNLETQIGDFVLKRADGLFAYQLAVVVDDAAQGVTHVVRGADLLNSTPRQIYLQQLLGLPTPNYAHVPIATNSKGEKLSKQTLAEPISIRLAGHHLFDALCFLGQNPPAEMQNATLDEMWRWSLNNWSLAKIPHQRELISLKA